jgi:hypothetical protein
MASALSSTLMVCLPEFNLHPAVMGSSVVCGPMALGQQEIVFSHDPMDSFAVRGLTPVFRDSRC